MASNSSDVHSLIAEGESILVEFKSDRGPLHDSEMVEAVVCLANAEGGVLLIGVENDGTITGLHRSHRTSPSLLRAFIQGQTVPPQAVQVEFVDLSEGPVAVIKVQRSKQPVATSSGKSVIRYVAASGEPGCRPFYPFEMQSWHAAHGAVDVSALPVQGASWDDLDPVEFVRLRRMVEENRGDAALQQLSDERIALALGLARSQDGGIAPTLAGILLLGRELALYEHVPAHEVAFQVLRGTDVLLNEFRRWPLLRSLEWVSEAFQIRNEERELNIGMFRVGVPAYDQRGFREAVNNALIHRDYQRLGAVHIQMHEDHIRISNPGGFVQGVRPENLLVTEPRPRNPCLADAFKRVGLVERTGRGVAIIYSGQLRNGRLPPDYSLSTESSVSLFLPGGPADLEFVRVVVAEENRRQRALPVDELLILGHVWRERSIDTPTASRLIQRNDAEARRVLEGLVEFGFLERRGQRKGRTYLLSASVYRELGRPAAYVRAKGFEPEQMEQMVLQYVRAHGQITRREAIDLCRISSYQAFRLLKRLVERGSLDQRGHGKGTYYTARA